MERLFVSFVAEAQPWNPLQNVRVGHGRGAMVVSHPQLPSNLGHAKLHLRDGHFPNNNNDNRRFGPSSSQPPSRGHTKLVLSPLRDGPHHLPGNNNEHTRGPQAKQQRQQQ